jgi:ABC-type oligopeptide transport system ATPase subunit
MATLARSVLRLLVKSKGRVWVAKKGFKLWRMLPKQQRRQTLKFAARRVPKLASGAMRRGKR